MAKLVPLIFMNEFKTIYLVKFVDPTSHCEWSPLTDSINDKPLECVTIGFIASKDKHNTVISSEYSVDMETGELTIGNKTVIPNSCIIKMKRILNVKQVF